MIKINKLGLKDLSLQRWYDSDSDDVLNLFYIPALSQSVSYKRLTGFFSSSSLAVAAKGIIELIQNGGKVELVTSPKFSYEDIEAIKSVYETPESLSEKIMLEEFDNIHDEFINDHVKAFGWMLKNGLLKIKVAFVLGDDGYPINEEEINCKGLFHQKVGILEDSEGYKLSFSGSENETAFGWKYNVEEFKVFRSWESVELHYFVSDELKFEKYWEGYPNKTKIIDLPLAIKNKLVEIAPKNIEDINLRKWYKTEPKRKIKLREYQKLAVNNWVSNDMQGIFEMATGTGKTFAALECINELIKKEKKTITIISCPYNHLITQWYKEIDKYGITFSRVIADSTNPKWDDIISNKLLDFQIGLLDFLIILTTHDTLSGEKFINIMSTTDIPIFLIVDEVHGIGSPKRKNGLLTTYEYRLGLSATPKRWYDIEGTKELFSYFKDTVYEYPLSKAIGKFLIEYEYHPHFINLTEEELEEYHNQTNKIVRAYYASRGDKEKEEIYNLLCIKRQDIVKNAESKYEVLNKIIKVNLDITHCLVYCAPKQIQRVQNILLKNNIKQHKFTEVEGVRPKTDYGDISQRDYLLQSFSKGILQVLVAMKCLDEGVDVPPARIAIMMSNSGNPREYVQRRGRVLRKHPGKKFSIIHDIIVVPQLESYSEISEIEKKIFLKELKRYKEFSLLAKNSVECMSLIEQLEDEYGIYG